MKRFREMSSAEFGQLKNKAKLQKFSPFAQFCLDSKGYNYQTKNGGQLDKWEVFFMGYQNAKAIISGVVDKIVAVKKNIR